MTVQYRSMSCKETYIPSQHFVEHVAGETRLGRIGGREVRVFSYPVVGEDEAEEPEEDVDVEEEEGVGEDERVRGAPGGDRPGVVSPSTHEGHVEEDGRERDEGRDDQVLEGHGSQR
jgi:hypothetical protein